YNTPAHSLSSSSPFTPPTAPLTTTPQSLPIAVPHSGPIPSSSLANLPEPSSKSGPLSRPSMPGGSAAGHTERAGSAATFPRAGGLGGGRGGEEGDAVVWGGSVVVHLLGQQRRFELDDPCWHAVAVSDYESICRGGEGLGGFDAGAADGGGRGGGGGVMLGSGRAAYGSSATQHRRVAVPLNTEEWQCHSTQKSGSATQHRRVAVPLNTEEWQCHSTQKSGSATQHRRVAVPLNTEEWQCHSTQKSGSATQHRRVAVPLNTEEWQCHSTQKSGSATQHRRVAVPLNTEEWQCHSTQKSGSATQHRRVAVPLNTEEWQSVRVATAFVENARRLQQVSQQAFILFAAQAPLPPKAARVCGADGLPTATCFPMPPCGSSAPPASD
ncbi:unnamed protein product, partial [Closterium sp. Naga37s-1]